MKTEKNPTKKTSSSKPTLCKGFQNLYTLEFDVVQNAQAKIPWSPMFQLCKNFYPNLQVPRVLNAGFLLALTTQFCRKQWHI